MRTITIYFCLVLSLLCTGFAIAQDDIQRVRIDFQNPEGFTRHLLLSFVSDNVASDGVDYGYDALNRGELSDDLNWIIEDERYVIQGVGSFSADKYYPFGMFLTNSGDITISLDELENFEENIDVYLYDLELNTYTLLNAGTYANTLAAQTYLNRFFLTFSNSIDGIISNNLLSTTENEITDLKIWHSNLSDELHIKGISNNNNSMLVTVLSIDGKQIIEERISGQTNDDDIKLSTSGFSNGVYILKIDTSSFSYTTKVCITN